MWSAGGNCGRKRIKQPSATGSRLQQKQQQQVLWVLPISFLVRSRHHEQENPLQGVLLRLDPAMLPHLRANRQHSRIFRRRKGERPDKFRLCLYRASARGLCPGSCYRSQACVLHAAHSVGGLHAWSASY